MRQGSYSSFLVSKSVTVYAQCEWSCDHKATYGSASSIFNLQGLKKKSFRAENSPHTSGLQNKDPQPQEIINFNNRGLLSLNSER